MTRKVKNILKDWDLKSRNSSLINFWTTLSKLYKCSE